MFVVSEVDQLHVVAYYAWCMASVATQPIALLGRLGVDERHEGQGLGAAIGCRGLLLLKDIRRTLGALPR